MENPSSQTPNRAVTRLKTPLQATVSLPVLIFQCSNSILQCAQSDAQDAIFLPQKCNSILRATDDFRQIKTNRKAVRALEAAARNRLQRSTPRKKFACQMEKTMSRKTTSQASQRCCSFCKTVRVNTNTPKTISLRIILCRRPYMNDFFNRCMQEGSRDIC